MPWNEPGNKGNQNTPPDIDEMLKKLFTAIKSNGNGNKGSGKPPSSGVPWFKRIGLIFSILVIAYIASGIFLVQPAEQAVIKQFGKFVGTVGPGPHWIPTFVRTKMIQDIQQVFTSEHEAQMLTKDENIVDVQITVQYRIDDLPEYFFKVVDPQFSLKEVTDSALRTVVGHSTMDEILTVGRAVIATKIQSEMEKVLQLYQSGLTVVVVTMQHARAPEPVKAAFDDVIKAREDEIRLVNQAEAYKLSKEPVARGQAKRLLEEAQAYKEAQVLLAKGETSRFEALLPEYRKAPQIMRDRMYYATISNLFASMPKVVVDTKGGNLFYLPLDKIMSRQNASNIEIPKAFPNQIDGGSITTPSANNQPNISRQERLRKLYRRDRRNS